MQKDIKQILHQGKSDNASENKRQEMLALFHQAECEYELKGQLFEELQNTEVEEEVSTPYFKNLFTKLWSKIEKVKSTKKSKIVFFGTFSKIAAVIIIGILTGFLVHSKRASKSVNYYAAHSPKGSISEVILPDSSIIFLNADSRIKYSCNNRKGIREVYLEGEAWFDVRKNKKKLFVVHTPFYDVNVTGTQFNIKAYKADQKLTTTLETGQIIILPTDQFKLAEKITLVPGEQIVLDKKTKKLNIKKVNTKWFTSWKDNKLIFVNMSLKELIILLERKYGVEIEVKNEALLDLHFDGTIKNETIIEILDYIKIALPIKYNIVEQKIEITSK